MNLNTEHQVTLTTRQCAALLSAAKTIMDAYDKRGIDTSNPAYTDLTAAVGRMAAGMGFTPKDAAELLHFMSTGRRPTDNSWKGMTQ